jgi:outer membrane protein OmpA-like peptidoglycan-associated protein
MTVRSGWAAAAVAGVVAFAGLAPGAARPRAAVAQADERPGTGAWANYDFVPGERVLFAEDFTADAVGDFPRRLTLVRGNWEIVEWQGRRLLRNTGPRGAAVQIALPEPVPERFTIELHVHFPHGNQRLGIALHAPARSLVQTGALEDNYFQVGATGTGVAAGRKGGVEVLTRTPGVLEKALTPIRIMVDGQHTKVFVNERRVANVPNASFTRGRAIHLENLYFADEANPMHFSAIRVAAGGRALYDVLEAEGRVATQGIYFATDSDRLRPESTPTLKEIGEMLKAHPALRLAIEGHTDSDGDEAHNQRLSEGRAAAVKAYLVQAYAIDAGRLETAGHGESKPAADNATPEGKQQNRRVELVKLGGLD